MSRGVVASLRDLVPIRPLSREEALRIAELQASRLLEFAGLSQGPVPEGLIADLPRLRVLRQSPWPASGAAQWVSSQWIVVLNADEPPTRQRFSLAHEFKHILDDRFVKLIYAGVPEAERNAWQELVCDYFAGCLLMPRPWVKRAWASGVQDPRTLARMFDVSAAAIRVRLDQIGLSVPVRRHSQRPTSREEFLRLARTARYQRALPVALDLAA